MNKIILAALAVTTLGLTAVSVMPTFAQARPGGAHAGNGGGRLKKMAQSLGLTDAQKAQMKPILMSGRAQAMAVKADTTLTPQAREAKMKGIRRLTMQQMRAILTPEQREKIKGMQAERREARHGKA